MTRRLVIVALAVAFGLTIAAPAAFAMPGDPGAGSGQGETKPKPWVYEYLERRYGTAEEPWEMFGFAVLEPHGRDASVRYVDEDGIEHHKVDSVVAGR